MNGMVASEIAPAAAVSTVLASEREFDLRHQSMIRGSDALVEACLEDMTEENLAIVEKLFDQFRVDLAYCRTHSKLEGPS
jgi:site-specific recombinase